MLALFAPAPERKIDYMVAANEPLPSSLRGPRGEFLPDVTARPVWRLMVRGLSVYLPDRRVDPGRLRVLDSRGPYRAPRPARPLFLDDVSGFGLQLRRRARGLEPEREIYVRGKQTQTFGMVIAGPAAAVGTRVVDAAALLRFARRLLFAELYDPDRPDTVADAVRGARSIEGVVLVDRAEGVGLCAEVDPVTRETSCPVALRFEDGAVQTYAVASWVAGPPLAQAG
jgi:hypothetical protein